MYFECVRVLVARDLPRIRVRNSPRVSGLIWSKCLERRRRHRRRRRRRHPRNLPTFIVLLFSDV